MQRNVEIQMFIPDLVATASSIMHAGTDRQRNRRREDRDVQLRRAARAPFSYTPDVLRDLTNKVPLRNRDHRT
ncbi:hypothetical protein [Haloechinothrix salitolerans]|uniref:Uncharacterized protein n=1 Tax=Haloechinothrix salitolerans TaxID=926830 RepID=A0ABW2C3E3_9PSEU